MIKLDEERIRESRREMIDKMMIIHGSNLKDVKEFIEKLNSIQGVKAYRLETKEIDSAFKLIINLLTEINTILWAPIIYYFLNKKKESNNKISLDYKKVTFNQGDNEKIIEEKLKIVTSKSQKK